jgi:hypothetical protein
MPEKAEGTVMEYLVVIALFAFIFSLMYVVYKSYHQD